MKRHLWVFSPVDRKIGTLGRKLITLLTKRTVRLAYPSYFFSIANRCTLKTLPSASGPYTKPCCSSLPVGNLSIAIKRKLDSNCIEEQLIEPCKHVPPPWSSVQQLSGISTAPVFFWFCASSIQFAHFLVSEGQPGTPGQGSLLIQSSLSRYTSVHGV